jgi:hypothetical protein
MAVNLLYQLKTQLVIIGLGTTFICTVRLFLLVWKYFWLSKRFKDHLNHIDPIAYLSIYTFQGRPSRSISQIWAIKNYLAEKGKDADPELLELRKRLDSPVKWGLLTVLMIPGGIIFAGVIMTFF